MLFSWTIFQHVFFFVQEVFQFFVQTNACTKMFFWKAKSPIEKFQVDGWVYNTVELLSPKIAPCLLQSFLSQPNILCISTGQFGTSRFMSRLNIKYQCFIKLYLSYPNHIETTTTCCPQSFQGFYSYHADSVECDRYCSSLASGMKNVMKWHEKLIQGIKASVSAVITEQPLTFIYAQKMCLRMCVCVWEKIKECVFECATATEW